jgi:aspartate aminotransferase
MHIQEALDRALRDGFTHYTESRGLPALREAISEKLRRDNSIAADPRDEIIVTPGGKHALFCAITALVDRGDEVVILDPSWVSYEPIVRMVGGAPINIALTSSSGFHVAADMIEACVTPRTKLIIINSPNNPTGRVYSRSELEAIASVALRHDLFVISDEVYEKLVFDDRRAESIATLAGMSDRTITINSFSKTYAMTGWRLGYLAGPRRLVKEIFKVHQHSVTCAPAFTQMAGIAALRGPQACVAEMVAEFSTRRNRIDEVLGKVPGLKLKKPEGTFYLFLDISNFSRSSVDFARDLLERAHVGVTPGTGFGKSYGDHVRLAFTQPGPRIEEALKRISRALQTAATHEDIGNVRGVL